MTNFLVTMVTLYPWFTFLLVFFAIVGGACTLFWLWDGIRFTRDWMIHQREKWRDDGRPDRALSVLCPLCFAAPGEPCTLEPDSVYAGLTHGVRVLAWAESVEDDPPEYQHPDGDDDDPLPEADESWVTDLRAIAAALKDMNDDDQLPDGPLRCMDRDCYRVGHSLDEECEFAPTMPAACYTDPDGPAGPPVPWSGWAAALPLHPQIRIDLSGAGFGAHDYIEDVAESAFTAAEAAEVQAKMRELER